VPQPTTYCIPSDSAADHTTDNKADPWGLTCRTGADAPDVVALSHRPDSVERRAASRRAVWTILPDSVRRCRPRCHQFVNPLASGDRVHEVDNQPTATRTSAAADRSLEVLPPPQPVSGGQHEYTGGQALRRPRPLARRAEMIARPARVRMRSRKPWVFARRRLLGWNVRLLTRSSRIIALTVDAASEQTAAAGLSQS